MIQKIKSIIFLVVATTLLFTVGCKDADDEVSINLEDLEVSVGENPAAGYVLGTIESNVSKSLTYSISSQTPEGAININSGTGEISVADPDLFDFETNPLITATISVEKAQNTASVTISITNIIEVSAQDFSVTIDENPAQGQSLGSVEASGEGTLSYSISSSTPAGALSIDASTGELTAADVALFDFETNPVITANIAVTDAGTVENLTATINLNNVNELSVEDYETTIDENASDNQSIGFVPVIGDGDLSFSIISQTPSNAMDIDQFDGELTVRTPEIFDYETNPVITASISVSNESSGETVDQTLTVTINLNNENEIGDFAYGGVIFWMNAEGNGGLVCTISDIYGGNTTTWNNGSNISTGATATAIGTGEANTNAIVASQGSGTYAAWECAALNLNSYTDWYLPSIDELGEMYANRSAINATAVANGGANFSTVTWSSTEQTGNVNNAYIYLFVDGQSPTLNAKANSAKVRAVRSWSDL